MRKFLLLMIALLAGVSGAWADVTVTLANGSSDPYDLGTRSNSDKRFTTSNTSGLEGVVLDVTGAVDHYTTGTYAGRLALKTSAASADETWTITAPAGYGIKAYSFQALCAGSYTATITAGETEYSISNSSGSYTTVSESGLNVPSVSFTVNASAANWIAVGPFTVTVYPILEDTKLYRLKQEWRNNGTNDYYLYANTSDVDNGRRLWKTNTATNTTLLTNSNYIWQAKSSSDNWLLYNIGGERYIAKAASASTSGSACTPLSATSTDDAEPLSLVNLSATVAGCVNLKATSQSGIYLDSYGTSGAHTNYVGWHTSTTHSGSFFKFIPVKTVTFSTAVSVNGGDAVSTIYVATDGSDAITLSNAYKYSFDGGTNYVNPTVAASTITAAGTSDMTVTVAALTANYTLMYNSAQVGEILGHAVTFGEAPSVSEFGMAFTTYTTDPETYDDITTTDVTVTATWNNSALQFVTGNPNTISKWYRVRMHSNQTHYVYNKSGAIAFLDDAKPSLSSEDYLWGFAGNPFNGFQVYNKTAGTGVALDNANPCTLSADGKNVAFKIAIGSEGSNGSTADTYFALYVESGSYLNYRAVGNIQHWSDNDEGSTFMINAVKKVDFVDGNSDAFAVAVNGGSAVSTIWVATDGSDSFTLPAGYKYNFGGTTYYSATAAAAAIAAAGTEDLTVTVVSSAVTDLANLSNTKAYVVTNARGTWQFADNATAMSVASTSYEPAEEAQQIAIINRNSNYYLFSVNAGAYLTGDNTLTTKPTDNEQVDIVATGNASYPWFFRFKNLKDENDKYTKNINISGTIKIDGWGPGGSNTSGSIDKGNSNAIIEAVDFDATAALAMFNETSVTYHLQWSDGTDLSGVVADVVVTDARESGNPAESLPATFENPFVTFSYSPAAIPASGTVTVTASWSEDAPFQLSDSYAEAKWYTVGIHTYYEGENHIWKYNSSNEMIGTETVATDAYGSITDNHLFCFVGNPYQGLSIYNKAAGSSKTLYHKTPSSYGDQAYMAAEGIKVLPEASIVSGKTVANGYACFLYNNDGSNNWYLNCHADGGDPYGIYGWNDAGQGSTCWFIEPSQYPYNYLNSYGDVWAAPYKAVGTKAVAEESIWVNAGSTKTYLAENPFYYANTIARTVVNEILDALDAAETITLGNGYYRVVSAVPGFNNTAAWYYNPSTSADHITWAKAATTTEHQVNSIFKFTANEDKWNIYSPNAQAYLTHDNTAFGAQTGTIGATAGDITLENLASTIQYKLYINVQGVHANGHSSGSGSAGTLINYNTGSNGASAWYLVKVDELEITLNSGGDSYYYATLCLPFDVTITDVHTSAYTLTLNGAKDALSLSTALTEIPAGTPVLLRGTQNKAKLSLASDAATSAPLTGTALTGVYTNTPVTGGTDYFLGLGESNTMGFYHWAGTTLKANRAYLEASKLSSSVKGFVLNWDELVDGIQTIDNGQLTKDNAVIYNLAGQRINKLQKGINIVNGKKVLVK